MAYYVNYLNVYEIIFDDMNIYNMKFCNVDADIWGLEQDQHVALRILRVSKSIEPPCMLLYSIARLHLVEITPFSWRNVFSRRKI